MTLRSYEVQRHVHVTLYSYEMQRNVHVTLVMKCNVMYIAKLGIYTKPFYCVNSVCHFTLFDTVH